MALNELPTFEARDEVHDLLNPVASIAGCAQTLLSWGDRIEVSVREDLVRLIIRQAEQLEAMIRARELDARPARASEASRHGRAS